MAEVKRVNGWQASDGNIFSERDHAEAHQEKLDFLAWWDANMPPNVDSLGTKVWDTWQVRRRPGA